MLSALIWCHHSYHKIYEFKNTELLGFSLFYIIQKLSYYFGTVQWKYSHPRQTLAGSYWLYVMPPRGRIRIIVLSITWQTSKDFFLDCLLYTFCLGVFQFLVSDLLLFHLTLSDYLWAANKWLDHQKDQEWLCPHPVAQKGWFVKSAISIYQECPAERMNSVLGNHSYFMISFIYHFYKMHYILYIVLALASFILYYKII